MNQNVLDGVVAIEAKAAEIVDEAKKRASEMDEKVKADLESLAQELDQKAEQEIAAYSQEVEGKQAAALAQLDQQLDAAMTALDAVKGESVASLAAEVAKLLEQRSHGN
jgi:hypothetical protein